MTNEELQRQMQGAGWQGRQPGTQRRDVDDRGNLIPVAPPGSPAGPAPDKQAMMIELLRQLPPEVLMQMASSGQGLPQPGGGGMPMPVPQGPAPTGNPVPQPMPTLPGKLPV